MINKWKKYILISFVPFATFNSIAQTCDTQSPEKIKLGDEAYFEVQEGELLTDTQKRKIEKIFKKMDRRISGVATEAYCFSQDNTVKHKQHKIKNGEVALLSDDILEMKFDIFDIENSVSKADEFKLFGHLSVDTVKSLTDDSLTVFSRYRQQGWGGSHMFERTLTFSTNDKYMTIESLTYINGYYSNSWKYDLRK